MIKWLELTFTCLRKPYLVRYYTTYYETLEWVGRISGTHYIKSESGLREGKYPTTV